MRGKMVFQPHCSVFKSHLFSLSLLGYFPVGMNDFTPVLTGVSSNVLFCVRIIATSTRLQEKNTLQDYVLIQTRYRTVGVGE